MLCFFVIRISCAEKAGISVFVSVSDWLPLWLPFSLQVSMSYMGCCFYRVLGFLFGFPFNLLEGCVGRGTLAQLHAASLRKLSARC